MNVAIGCDGLPPVVDLRGRADDRGATLVATEVALADEVAAASGLVMAKDARVPVAVVRGVDRLGGADGAGARPRASCARGPVPRPRRCRRCTTGARRVRSAPATCRPTALEQAIAAACTAPAPQHTRPWRFSVLRSDAARRGYLAAIAADARSASDDGARRGARPDRAVALARAGASHPGRGASRRRARRCSCSRRARRSRPCCSRCRHRDSRAAGSARRSSAGTKHGPPSASTTSGSRWARSRVARCPHDRAARPDRTTDIARDRRLPMTPRAHRSLGTLYASEASPQPRKED